MSNQIYREEFMEIYKSGLNYGLMSDPTLTGIKTNSACGDKVTLHLKIEGDKVVDAKYYGTSCAVSRTSSSIFTEHIKGKTIDELKKLSEEEVLGLINFGLTSNRQQCALLCYYALQEGLKNYGKNHEKDKNQETGK